MNATCTNSIVSNALLALAAVACLMTSPAFASETAAAAASPQRPHIVFVLLDDLDTADVGVYASSDIRTPSIDALARSGLRFDRYYAGAPVCSPTRVALLTGVHPASMGFLRAVLPTSLRGIASTIPTLAQVLQSSGYRTVHLGKWHVGSGREVYLPTRKGFERSYRFEGRGYFDQSLIVDDAAEQPIPTDVHLTTALTDLAIEELRSSIASDPARPVFINLWHFAPHEPIEPPRNFDNSETGYCLDATAGCDISRGEYAALVTHVDQELGRLMDALDALGIADNTLVIVASDNGGTPGNHARRTIPERTLSGYKGTMSEGAIRVPMVVRWPGTVAPNSNTTATVTSVDLLPTLAAIAGATLDAGTQLDGRSFLDVLQGQARVDSDDALIWENKPANNAALDFTRITNTFAVRKGPWKLLYHPAMNPLASDRRELFNVATDPGERHNLLAAKPYFSFGPYGRWDLRIPQVSIYRGGDADPAETYRVIANDLEHEYWQWRFSRGEIPYVTASARDARSPATLNFDERLDFNDGDFTFLTGVDVATGAPETATGVIAERPGSWRLSLQEGRVHLHVRGAHSVGVKVDVADEAQLSSTTRLKPGAHHVAFTAYGFRDAATVLHLFIDGVAVASSGGGNTIAAAAGGTTEAPYTLVIGNDAEANEPFPGEVELPKAYTRSFYAAEVMGAYARWLTQQGL